MSKYAIVKIGPFQYTVEEGKEYSVPKFAAAEGSKIAVGEVLAVGEGDKIEFGKPYVSGIVVNIEIIEQGKGEKIKTQVYKAKSRYRKTTGHRKKITTFTVVSIGKGKASAVKEEVKAEVATKATKKVSKPKATTKKKASSSK